jgi:hypothetical protein
MNAFNDGIKIGKDLRYEYEDSEIKHLEKIAEDAHNLALVSDHIADNYHIHTKITGSDEDGYKLHIFVTKNAEIKRKENIHEQETDI